MANGCNRGKRSFSGITAGSPKGPALSQAGTLPTALEGHPGDAPGNRRTSQAWRWRELDLSQWGENLGEAARLLEPGQAARRRRPRRAGAAAGRKPEGRPEAQGGMAARSGRCGGRIAGLREDEAHEGSGLRRLANSRPEHPDSGDEKPRGRACGVRGRFRALLSAAKCTAGGRPTSWR
jgi:hypothetical protein